jgi:hypothetical protein
MPIADHLDLLDHLEEWSRRHANERGDVKFGRTMDDRPKAGAWVGGDHDHRLAELIVWSTGEAELALGFASDPQVNEHHELTSVAALDAVLDRMSSWLDASDG